MKKKQYLVNSTTKDLKWTECKSATRTFKLQDEPELIHVIETGFKDKYMVVYEDAYEYAIGKVAFCTKAEIQKMFNIAL